MTIQAVEIYPCIKNFPETCNDIVPIWEYVVFESGAIRYRYVQRADTLRRRFQLCKGFPIFGDYGYDLCRCPCGGTCLVRDDQPTRFPHGGADCCFVPWVQGCADR